MSLTTSRTRSYSGITIAVETPDADWNRARLAIASPNPPLRANGASSATRCTTRTARPSGDTRGGGVRCIPSRRSGKDDSNNIIAHDRQVCPPRTDRVTILFRHYPGNLRNVAEVMSNPCREELSQRHGAELRMHALQRELRVGESPTGKLRQIFGTQAREFVEQLWKRLP